MITEKKKKQIIESGKEYFRQIIIPGHLKNLQALKLRDFKINPFLVNYLAAFLCGDTSPESLAKALVYPRILGTSINTSFGQNIQVFSSSLREVAGGAEFWKHLTGDRRFYNRLAKAFGEVEEDDTEGKHIALGIVSDLSVNIVSSLDAYAFTKSSAEVQK